MIFTGEIAVALAEKFGLPIQRKADARESYRRDIPLEDAQWILENGDPESIFVEAEPDMAEADEKL